MHWHAGCAHFVGSANDAPLVKCTLRPCRSDHKLGGRVTNDFMRLDVPTFPLRVFGVDVERGCLTALGRRG